MLKILLKKQFMETFSFLYQSDKKGKRRSPISIVGYAVLAIWVIGSMAALIGLLANAICEPLVRRGMGWMYYTLMGLSATAMGVVGSLFIAYPALYTAKDNELLLALPIKPSAILTARILGIYVLAFLCEALIMIPSMAVYFGKGYGTAEGVLLSVFTLVVLPLLAVVLSCVLGWVIAMLVPRVKYKGLMMLLLTIGFFAGYYYLVFQMNRYLQLLLTNITVVGKKLQVFVYPLYQMGVGMEGSLPAFLRFAGICTALFGMVYAALQASFLTLLTTKRSVARAEYQEEKIRFRGSKSALFQREWKRFWNIPIYLLNCGLGAVFLLIGAVLVLTKGAALTVAMKQASADIQEVFALGVCAVICVLTAMDAVTASSISLEGRNLWILQSLPVKPKEIFTAKIKLHLLVNSLPALIFSMAAYRRLQTEFALAVLLILTTQLFILFCALSGLAINLKFPNLNWSSETVVVKRGLSAFIGIFGNMAIVFALGGIYVLVQKQLPAHLFLCGSVILLAGGGWAIGRWLKTHGEQIFCRL